MKPSCKLFTTEITQSSQFRLADDVPSSSASLNNTSTNPQRQSPDLMCTRIYGGEGGEPMEAVFGQTITSMEAFGDEKYGLLALKVTFSTGNQVEVNVIRPHYRSHGVINLGSDAIMELYVKTVQDNAYFIPGGFGVVEIYLRTLKGQVYATTEYHPGNGETGNWYPVMDGAGFTPLQNIVLAGVKAKTSGCIDSLAFYYRKEVLTARVMEDFEYDGVLVEPEPEEITVASVLLQSRKSKDEKAAISFDETLGSSFRWTLDAEFRTGESVIINTPLPYVEAGEVLFSRNFTFGYAWGEELPAYKDFGYQAEVRIPQGKIVRAAAIAQAFHLAGKFSAKVKEHWLYSGAITRTVVGKLEGVSAFEVKVHYSGQDQEEE
ncbi:MAG TPA: hypothetical protein DCP28_01170 [Cytophagales bacterium]|nr:hypothetical protein [Cytophagales bacterium]